MMCLFFAIMKTCCVYCGGQETSTNAPVRFAVSLLQVTKLSSSTLKITYFSHGEVQALHV